MISNCYEISTKPTTQFKNKFSAEFRPIKRIRIPNVVLLLKFYNLVRLRERISQIYADSFWPKWCARTKLKEAKVSIASSMGTKTNSKQTKNQGK